MSFFRRRRKGTTNANIKVEDVYVITAMIISDYDDGTGFGPVCVDMCFLAKYKGGKYYELFSGKELEKEKQSEDRILQMTFDTPYVKKAEPLKRYLKDKSKKNVDVQLLFDFITKMNVLNSLGAFKNEENDKNNEK